MYRVGRRIGFLATTVIAVVFMIATAFCQSLIAFTIMRFFVAMATIALFTVAFVIGELIKIIHLLISNCDSCDKSNPTENQIQPNLQLSVKMNSHQIF